jgi:ribosomal protein S18 acetylase RimI-like enzyme
VNIRPYGSSDEPQVRRICLDTALYGAPIQQCVADDLLVTEALLGYYLRFEPDALLIADDGNEVVGYLAGARHTLRFERLFASRVLPGLALGFLMRGHWHRARSWRIAAAQAVNGARLLRVRNSVAKLYPATLHVNVDERCRGRGVGTLLLQRFLGLLESEGVPGVHVSTETDAGAAFFARHGFSDLGSRRMMSICGRESPVARVMGRAVAEADF